MNYHKSMLLHTVPEHPNEVNSQHLRNILEREPHGHELVKDLSGTIRWKPDFRMIELIDKMGLNNILETLMSYGFDKNSEFYRALYRDMGVSLNKYFEVFYTNINNDDADNYKYSTCLCCHKSTD